MPIEAAHAELEGCHAGVARIGFVRISGEPGGSTGRVGSVPQRLVTEVVGIAARRYPGTGEGVSGFLEPAWPWRKISPHRSAVLS